MYETFGEDPYLASEMGAAIIKGMQGSPVDLKNPLRVAATMKHFVGYPNPRTGHDRAPSWIPYNFLLQYFLPSFRAAVEAGVATVMESYNEINGVPVASSSLFLKVSKLRCHRFHTYTHAHILFIVESFTSFKFTLKYVIPLVLPLSQHLLREELKFNGTLVTDYAEINNLQSWHKIVATQEVCILVIN